MPPPIRPPTERTRPRAGPAESIRRNGSPTSTLAPDSPSFAELGALRVFPGRELVGLRYRRPLELVPLPDDRSSRVVVPGAFVSAAVGVRIAKHGNRGVTSAYGLARSNVGSLTVTAAAPSIGTQPQAVSTTYGQSASFTVTATGYPQPTFNLTGTLPAGVSFNTATGDLTGVATTPGIYSATVTARLAFFG